MGAPAQDDDEPSVTPSASGGGPPPAPPRQAPPNQPPPGQPTPYQAPPYQQAPYQGYPPPGYPPPGYAAPPGYPPPGYAAYPGYPPMQLTKVHRPRRGLVTGGAITFGVSWGIAASISFILGTSTCSGSSCNSADYLWIPVAGPLVVAAKESGSDGPGIFILWSAAQAAGVIMFIVGMAGHDVMEYRIAKNGPTLTLAPLFAREATGMGLTARW